MLITGLLVMEMLLLKYVGIGIFELTMVKKITSKKRTRWDKYLPLAGKERKPLIVTKSIIGTFPIGGPI